MHFLISSTTLLKHLQNISGVLSTNNSLPILDNFLFDIADGILSVSASDLGTTMHTNFPVDAKENGKICIPAKQLLEMLKSFPEQPLNFQVDTQKFSISISSENGSYSMVGQNGEEFPKAVEIQDTNSIKVSGDVLSKAINKTLFATGNDELRPVMGGVFCQFSPEEIIFVATDAHKLVRYKRTDSVASGSSSFILPKKPLNLLKTNLKGDEEVMILYNGSNAVFQFNDIEMVCRLVDGKYPNYEAVIPKENPNVLTIDRISLLNSLKRVSIFANKTTHQVQLKLAGSELKISAEDIDFSNEATERLTSNYVGEDMDIAFNSRFLVEMLTNIDANEIKIEMSEPNRAGIIVPAANENQEEDILMLVMPVMINR
jgi:DNA polymerase-3 subunit beta